MSEAITENPFEKYETLLKKIDDGKFFEPFITLLGNISSGSTISLQSITEYLKGVEPKSNKILETFVESVYPLSDKTQIHDLYKILIDHKIRVIRYYMLFEKVYPNLNFGLQQIFQNWKVSMQDRLLSHDSDKFTDPIVVKSYVVTFYLKHIIEELKKLEDNEEDKKQCIEIINTIMKQLYFSHGKYQPHHSEHYVSDEEANKVLQEDRCLLLEYFFDIHAVGDRFNENFGDYVGREANGVSDSYFKDFTGSFRQLDEAFKETYPELFEQKAKVKELKLAIKKLQEEKAKLESVKQELEEKIRQASEISEEELKQTSAVLFKEDVVKMRKEKEKLEEVKKQLEIILTQKIAEYNTERECFMIDFWTSSDSLSSKPEVLSVVRDLTQNLYLATEQDFEDADLKEPHSKFMEEIVNVPEYLGYFFNSENVEDLKLQLKKKVRDMEDKEQHLNEIVAILSVVDCNLEDLNIDDKQHIREIEMKRVYILENRDKSFFQA